MRSGCVAEACCSLAWRHFSFLFTDGGNWPGGLLKRPRPHKKSELEVIYVQSSEASGENVPELREWAVDLKFNGRNVSCFPSFHRGRDCKLRGGEGERRGQSSEGGEGGVCLRAVAGDDGAGSRTNPFQARG